MIYNFFWKYYQIIYAGIIVTVFTSGWMHADYVLMSGPESTWSWHLFQWLPLLGGAFSFFAHGYFICAKSYEFIHSGFGWFGLMAAPYAAAGLGYVLGYHIF